MSFVKKTRDSSTDCSDRTVSMLKEEFTPPITDLYLWEKILLIKNQDLNFTKCYGIHKTLRLSYVEALF